MPSHALTSFISHHSSLITHHYCRATPIALVLTPIPTLSLPTLSPPIKAESLKTFIEDKWRPLVGQWTLRTAERYVSKGLPVLTLYARADVEKDAKLYRYYASRMRKLAKQTPEVLFTIGNPAEQIKAR